jgi:hypothetical protein
MLSAHRVLAAGAAFAVGCSTIAGIDGLNIGSRTDSGVAHDGGASDGSTLDALPEAGGDAAAPVVEPCQRAAPFQAPRELMTLPAASGIPRLTPDELTLYISIPTGLDASAKADLARATRASLADPFGLPEALPGLNSALDDRDPMVSSNQLLLFFHSYRPGVASGTGADLWAASRASATADFGPPALVPDVNTTAHEAQPYFRTQGRELYFTRDVPGDGGVHREIMLSVDNGTSFSKPKAIAEVNSPQHDFQPVVTEDGLTMLLASNRPGDENESKGNFDLWIAERTSESMPWQKPRNIEELNTNGIEYAGFISADRCRIYFTRAAVAEPVVHVLIAERPR